MHKGPEVGRSAVGVRYTEWLEHPVGRGRVGMWPVFPGATPV